MLLAPSLFYGRKNVKLSRFRHPTLRDMTTMKSDGWTKLVSELSVSYNCIFVVIAAITYPKYPNTVKMWRILPTIGAVRNLNREVPDGPFMN